MRIIKDARYRVISDNYNNFHPGDIVVALENSIVPYCVHEENIYLKIGALTIIIRYVLKNLKC